MKLRCVVKVKWIYLKFKIKSCTCTTYNIVRIQQLVRSQIGALCDIVSSCDGSQLNTKNFGKMWTWSGELLRVSGRVCTKYLLSRLLAFTAAKTLVFRVSPAMGMDSCWMYDESCTWTLHFSILVWLPESPHIPIIWLWWHEVWNALMMMHSHECINACICLLNCYELTL